MKLWLVSQEENSGYDTFDSFVVASQSDQSARFILPGCQDWSDKYNGWAHDPDNVTVKCIGEASADLKEGEIICASFNAG